MAAILLGAVYFIMELLCGFIIPGPAIPIYIKWLYWAVRTVTTRTETQSPKLVLSSSLAKKHRLRFAPCLAWRT